MIRTFVILFLLSLPVIGLAQDLPQDIQLLLEQFLEDQELDEFDISDLIIRLESYQSNPINLNKADFEDLKDLLLLTDLQIQNILVHRAKYGDLIAAEELQSIPGMDLESIKRVLPFVSVKDPNKFQYKLSKMLVEGKNEVFLKWRSVLEDQKGYALNDEGESAYLGDPNRYFVRYRHNYENRMRYGFTLEKDPGEEFFTGSNKQGFDYMTAHLHLKDYSNFLKDIVVGDYNFSLGQGLIEHNNFGAGKSAWVTSIKKGGRTFKPYNSVNENDYFRGVGLTMRPVKHVELSLMGSVKKLDASFIEQDTTDGPDNTDLEFTTLRLDGYHRTASEIEKKDVINSWQIGGILKYTRNNGHIALNFMQNNLAGNFIPSDKLYKRFQSLPSKLNNISTDYAFRLKNFHFFGEVATNTGENWAQVHGLLIGLDPSISAAVLYRDYSPGYLALSPNAFGESSTVQNEKGLYLGLEIRPVYAWKLSLYADVWKNPWLRFQIDRPSFGREFLARLDYIVKRKLNLYTQFTFEQKERNFEKGNSILSSLEDVNRYKLRLHLSYKVNKALELRSRLELNYYKHGGKNDSNGMMLYQDILFKPQGKPYRITARYAIFDTGGYNSRIYAYENDILYEFYIPAFSNRGTRYYINLRYNFSRWLVGELRFARTHYENLEVISSGNNRIDGDTQTEMKAQLVFKF